MMKKFKKETIHDKCKKAKQHKEAALSLILHNIVTNLFNKLIIILLYIFILLTVIS